MDMQRNFLPLGLLAAEERRQDGDNLGKSVEVDLELLGDELRGLAELGVEISTVRAGGHGGAEDRLDEEAVVGLQGLSVCSTEGIRKLLRGSSNVAGEGLGGEVETSVDGTY